MGSKCVLPRDSGEPADFAAVCAEASRCSKPRVNLASLQMPLVPELMQNSAIADMF